MPRKKTSGMPEQVSVRELLRRRWQEKADRWQHVPGAPWQAKLARLDAGEVIPVEAFELLGTGARVNRAGHYLLHPDGSLTNYIPDGSSSGPEL